eukprot:11186899-Lingulodinium_polyedra.AAC.1
MPTPMVRLPATLPRLRTLSRRMSRPRWLARLRVFVFHKSSAVAKPRTCVGQFADYSRLCMGTPTR